MFSKQLRGLFQTPSQLRANCIPELTKQQILRAEFHVLCAAQKQAVASSTYAALRREGRYLEQKPTEGLTPRCFFDYRQCDRPVEDCSDSREKLSQPICVRIGELRAPAQHGDNPLYARWVLVVEKLQFERGASNFDAVRLTNLREHFRDCLQNICQQFREFQSKSLPFCSPVAGS